MLLIGHCRSERGHKIGNRSVVVCWQAYQGTPRTIKDQPGRFRPAPRPFPTGRIRHRKRRRDLGNSPFRCLYDPRRTDFLFLRRDRRKMGGTAGRCVEKQRRRSPHAMARGPQGRTRSPSRSKSRHRSPAPCYRLIPFVIYPRSVVSRDKTRATFVIMFFCRS